MYVPKAKRQCGYCVLPLLDGDQFAGRLAVRNDRGRGVLVVERLYLESDVQPTDALRHAIEWQLTELAA